MPFQFNHFHILVEGLRWCLRNPFPSILYHISVLKGISSAQALLLLPLVAPMVAGQLSSFEQLRQAWLGSVVLDNQRSNFTFFTLVRSEATQATIGAQSGSREDRWMRLTTFNSWVWHWHNARKLMICAGLLPAHIHSTWTMDRSVSFYLLLWWIACVWKSETINSSISTQLNKVVTSLKSTSRTFVPSNR